MTQHFEHKASLGTIRQMQELCTEELAFVRVFAAAAPAAATAMATLDVGAAAGAAPLLAAALTTAAAPGSVTVAVDARPAAVRSLMERGRGGTLRGVHGVLVPQPRAERLATLLVGRDGTLEGAPRGHRGGAPGSSSGGGNSAPTVTLPHLQVRSATSRVRAPVLFGIHPVPRQLVFMPKRDGSRCKRLQQWPSGGVQELTPQGRFDFVKLDLRAADSEVLQDAASLSVLCAARCVALRARSPPADAAADAAAVAQFVAEGCSEARRAVAAPGGFTVACQEGALEGVGAQSHGGSSLA